MIDDVTWPQKVKVVSPKFFNLLLTNISWLAFWTQLKTDRMHHNIRGVKMTPTSRRRNKIGLPVEGLIAVLTRDDSHMKCDACWHITDQMMSLKICCSSIVKLSFSGWTNYSRTIFRLLFYCAHIICRIFSVCYIFKDKWIDLYNLLFSCWNVCLPVLHCAAYIVWQYWQIWTDFNNSFTVTFRDELHKKLVIKKLPRPIKSFAAPMAQLCRMLNGTPLQQLLSSRLV